MKTIFAIIAMLLLVALVSAKTEDVSVGPYKVSFDLNTTMNYTVTPDYVVNPDNSSTGTVKIQSENDTLALIGITNFNASQYAGFTRSDFLYMDLALRTDSNVIDGNVTKGVIDGKTGLIVTQTRRQPSDNSTADSMIALYWPDSQEIEGYGIPVAKTKVEIIANMPGAMSKDLLESIHVAQ
ncbi:MAG: hypothetical protein EHM14_11770 [Methanothrix sp.]|nr:MAG: hypothetical protein EHM14_11770 [Methanothrix sp.]